MATYSGMMSRVEGAAIHAQWRSGLPVINVPCWFDPNGGPIGLQVAGRPFADACLLRVADAYQRDTGRHARRPAV